MNIRIISRMLSMGILFFFLYVIYYAMFFNNGKVTLVFNAFNEGWLELVLTTAIFLMAVYTLKYDLQKEEGEYKD